MSTTVILDSFNLTKFIINFLESFDKKINDDPLLLFIIFISIVILAVKSILFKRKNSRSLISTILEKFFITQSSNNYASVFNNEETEKEINDRITNIENLLLSKDFDSIRSSIKENLKREIEDNIKDHLYAYLGNFTQNENLTEEFLTHSVQQYISRLLKEEKHIAAALSIQRERERIDRNNEMVNFIRQQSKSANTTRNAVSNIFILMNIFLIGFYVFLGSNVEEKTLITISITHVSLSAFMVYIFKASNSRISALLAILEDSNKHSKIDNLIESIGNKSNISGQDVDLIKIFLVNRAEREKNSLHPYEMIFKGITNSSIQFKGGKVEIDKK